MERPELSRSPDDDEDEHETVVNAGEKARLFAAAARRARSARHAQRAVLAQNDGSSSNPSRS